MKKVLLIMVVLLCCLLVPRMALADDDVEQAIEDEIAENIERALNAADLHEIESYYNEYAQTLNSLTGGSDLRSFMIMLIEGGAELDFTSIFNMMLDALFAGVKNSIPAIVQIIVVALIFSVITHFKPAFGSSGVSKAAKMAQYVIIGSMAISVLLSAFSVGTQAVNGMTDFTTDFFPIMFALLTALGGITSSAILSPATVFLTTGVTIFFKSFIMPLIIVSTVFTIINHFSSSVKLTGFCSLIKSIIKWGIGVSFTIFLGIITIQGLLGSTFDGLSIKTAKYTIDKFVPIIGGIFSESVDVLISCSLLIKNSVGIAGIIIIVGIVITPVFSILAHYFLFKLAGAVLEPVAGSDMGRFAQDAADVLLLLFAAVVAAAIIFFITTAVIIGAGNANVMLR